jgi:hypothetical protein
LEAPTLNKDVILARESREVKAYTKTGGTNAKKLINLVLLVVLQCTRSITTIYV